MKVYKDGRMAAVAPEDWAQSGPAVGFVTPQEARILPGIERLWHEAAEGQSVAMATRFESRYGFDYMVLKVPERGGGEAPEKSVNIYFTGEQLIFVCEDLPAVRATERELETWQGAPIAPEKVLYLFFAHLLAGDAGVLEDMEEEIAQLEDRVLAEKSEDVSGEVSGLRRRLLVLKRYYEGLFDLLQDLEENQNGFFSKGQLKYFRMHTNRADRLTRTVLNLRDYVTQVREAYQNQLDIQQNEIMKLFTVLTAIFLPLTLLTGWFGMNLMMPELKFPYTYPILIVACVLIVAGCIWYFKRKKWF